MPGATSPPKTAIALIGDSDLELRHLRAFVAVVDAGTVSRAAATLGLAQSTVSEALASLDRAIGTTTLQRRRGAPRITLSPAGRALLPHARRALDVLEAARRAVATTTRSASARFEIVANESVSTYLLAPVLASLRRTWPRTTFAVTIATCDNIRRRVAARSCALGVLIEEDRAPGSAMRDSDQWERHDLRPAIPLTAFVAASPRANPSSAAFKRSAFAGRRVFMPDAVGELPDLLRRYFREDRLPGPRLDSAGTIEGVRLGVADDPSAIGILPRYAIAEDIAKQRVRELALAPPLPLLRLVALLPLPAQPRHPAVNELLSALRR